MLEGCIKLKYMNCIVSKVTKAFAKNAWVPNKSINISCQIFNHIILWSIKWRMKNSLIRIKVITSILTWVSMKKVILMWPSQS